MNGRIIRPGEGSVLELPEVGRLKIGKKAQSQNGREYPTSVDYFIPTGKYAELFTKFVGDKPKTIQIIFPDDDAEKVCNERYEFRDNAGALVAKGDGTNFDVWNGTKYARYSLSDYPDLMQRISAKFNKKPRREGDDGWDIALTLRFIVPAVRGVVGVWQFSTKGAASSIKNIRNSFDGVQLMRGTVCQTVFDLSVEFAKSNKPNTNSKYPVVSLIANDNRVAEVKQMITQEAGVTLLNAGK